MCVETHSLKVTCVSTSISTVYSITVPPAQKKKNYFQDKLENI